MSVGSLPMRWPSRSRMHWAMVPTLLSLIEPSPSPVIPSLVWIFTKQQLPSTRNVSKPVILRPGNFALMSPLSSRPDRDER